jgi:hypothetical protein
MESYYKWAQTKKDMNEKMHMFMRISRNLDTKSE